MSTEQEALAVAEAAREKNWKQSFLKELFLGSFKFDMISPFPSKPETAEFTRFFNGFKKFLYTKVNPAEIDKTGEYPTDVIDGLRKLGAFGMKIPKEYGGLGFNQVEYDTIMKLLGSYDANLTALLSAHQSIGAPQPLKMFGTEEQKQKYLPRLAAGSISAFALTEPEVGSDPSSMKSLVERTNDGYTLNGKKLWCTNATLADMIIVMAKHSDTGKISAFVVEMNSPGVVIEHRCRFMGLRALSNAQLSFTNVFIPRENLVGNEGQGLKIALATLNTGRLAIPAGAAGAVKKCLEFVRRWANNRVQWGQSIGKHEAVSHMITDIASHAFAMDAVADLGSNLACDKNRDIRLEAAAAKEFNTFYGWKIIDDTMQIRGGRGYETETSLEERGELPMPVERMMRDFRINKIFEGSSEIMHLMIAREAVDKHMQVAGDLLNKKSSVWSKIKSIFKMAAFYTIWYPSKWIGWSHWPKFSKFGKLSKHLKFIDKNSRKLARSIFYGMLLNGPKLQYKQAFLFRIVDIALDLYAMSASLSRAESIHTNEANELAEAFCRTAEQRIKLRFKALWFNDDEKKRKVALKVLEGKHIWMEK
jgi:hypothetical protein